MAELIMKTIFITISRGSLIRNFFHTGVITRLLQKGYRIVVLTPHYKDLGLFAGYENKNLFFEPLHTPNIKFERLIIEFLKGAVFNRTVHFLWRYRLAGTDPRLSLYIPRLIFLAPLRFIPGFKRLIRWIDYILNPQTEHDYLFNKYKPELVFVTSVNSYSDSGLTKSAKRFGVISVGMPKSWDNLSKILFNAATDYLLVWSEFMREQAIRYQGYRRDQIFITGVPQCDIYKQKEHIISREQFCKQFNFDPNKKIVLYGSCGGGIGINMEADFPEMIQQWINSGKLSGVQILVRPHIGYKDEAEKFSRLKNYPDIVIDNTDTQDSRMSDRWDPSFNHIKHLYNSLYHANVCINIGSTLTLDATACGTPVINIKFDKDPNVAFRDSVRRLHETDYLIELMKMNTTWIVESLESFLKALQAILEQGETKDTRPMVDRFMYKNDGLSSERIVDALVSIAKDHEKI